MNQYETANISILEKAKSERLFMHYALFLALVLAVMGSVLIVLGIGDHLDIVVSATGAFETRLINASPGAGMVLGGLMIMAWSKPRRLKASASHAEQVDRWEQIEEDLRELLLSTASRESIKNKEHRDLTIKILMSYLKYGDDRLLPPIGPPPPAPTSEPEVAERTTLMSGKVNVMFSRTRDEFGDEEAITRILSEVPSEEPEPRKKSQSRQKPESGRVDLLYQETWPPRKSDDSE